MSSSAIRPDAVGTATPAVQAPSSDARSKSLGARVCAVVSRCLAWIAAIPVAIWNGCVHRYADARMFIRAFISMWGQTDSATIDRRVIQLTALSLSLRCLNYTGASLPAGLGAPVSVDEVKRQYDALDREVRDLLFYADATYVRQLGTASGGPERVVEMRDEILRECEKARSFQESLRAVNAFYRCFNCCTGDRPTTATSSSSSSTATAPVVGPGQQQATIQVVRPAHPVQVQQQVQPPIQPPIGQQQAEVVQVEEVVPPAPVGRPRAGPIPAPAPEVQPGGLFEDALRLVGGLFVNNNERPAARPAERQVRRAPVEAPARAQGPELAGTVPYVRDAIPNDVQANANAINALRERYDALRPRPPIPEHFECPVSAELMAIPVFISNHPSDMQQRSNRHHIDHTAAEGIFGDDDRGVMGEFGLIRANCPSCRHPMRRENLSIDTQLQGEILAHMRGAVGG